MSDEESADGDGLPPVRVRPIAEEEISEAFRWYEDKSQGLGSEFMRALDGSIAAIQRNPTAYPIIYKKARRVLLRRFPYSLFFLFENTTITVIACFHASRSPKQWRDRA